MSDERARRKVKKSGFFRKLMKIAFVAGVVAAVVRLEAPPGQGPRRREWQELPPPAGG